MAAREIKTAYLRSLEKTNQCDLTFWLTTTHQKYGSLNQEIKSVRQISDNVESLLTHTKNKIIKLFQDKQDVCVVPEELALEMNLSLSRNEQEFAGNMSCKELLLYKNKIKFNIFGITYRIIVNAPLIFQLTIPKFIFVNTCIKPLRLKGIHLHRGLSKYKWSRSTDLQNWTDVFYEESYTTTEEDLNCYIKLTVMPYSKDRTLGATVEAISENVVDVLPDIPDNDAHIDYRSPYTEHKLTKRSFRVISYNILAERYTDDDQFSYCNPKYLSIDYRRQLMLKELMNYKGDIICLQEVDIDYYYKYYKGHFTNNNYYSMCFKKGDVVPEGLLLAFDKNRFKKLHSRHIVLSKEIHKNPACKEICSFLRKRKEVQEYFMKQQTSLLVTTLKSIETNEIIIVANTHLYYHCEAPHIRLLQVAVILKCIKQQMKNIEAKGEAKVSVIFCGDFNSRPDTAVYQFLTDGKVSGTDEDLDSIAGGKSKIFEHDLDFFSSCGTPEFTNYTDDFKGCLDYIFCQRHIQVIQSLPFPPEEELAKDKALPNQYFPSDHISLVVDLLL